MVINKISTFFPRSLEKYFRFYEIYYYCYNLSKYGLYYDIILKHLSAYGGSSMLKHHTRRLALM